MRNSLVILDRCKPRQEHFTIYFEVHQTSKYSEEPRSFTYIPQHVVCLACDHSAEFKRTHFLRSSEPSAPLTSPSPSEGSMRNTPSSGRYCVSRSQSPWLTTCPARWTSPPLQTLETGETGMLVGRPGSSLPLPSSCVDALPASSYAND